MTRVHAGMSIMLGGALICGMAALAGRAADRGAGADHEGKKGLAVLTIVLMMVGVVTILGGFGFAVSSAVFP
jgi:nitrate reductase NapE component